MNKILSRFGSFDLAMIPIGRSSAAKQLASDMIRGSRVWQRINWSNYARTKFEESIFQVEAGATLSLSVER